MLLPLSLLLAQTQTQFVPPQWKDMPKRIEMLVSELQTPRLVGTNLSSQAVPRCRLAAAELLVIGKPAIPVLIKGLDSKDEFQLTNTIDTLGAAKSKDAVPKLIGIATGRETVDVSIAAIKALAAIGDAKAIEPLTALLSQKPEGDDNRGWVVAEAARALAQLKDPDSIQDIAGLLDREEVAGTWNNDYSVPLGTAAAVSLGSIGKKIVPVVAKYLDSPNKRVQLRAALALAFAGDRTGEQLLLDNIDTPLDREFGDFTEYSISNLKDEALVPWAVARLQKDPKDVIGAHVLACLPASVAGDVLAPYIVLAAEDAAVFPEEKRFTDPGYGPIFGTTLGQLDGANRDKFLYAMTRIALPSNTQLFRDEFLKTPTQVLAWPLSKLDPNFLMTWILRTEGRTSRYSERALALNFPGVRDFVLSRKDYYKPAEVVTFLASIGDPRDEELFLSSLGDVHLRQAALYGLLKIHKIDYSLPWPDQSS